MPQARTPELPPVLQQGFRPLFLLGALWAPLALTLWLAALAGRIELPTAMDPLAWHRHEMLFGQIGAIVAAFLLTAVPNWTGRLPVRGRPLAALVLLWLAARLAVLTGGWLGPWPGLLLDVAFPVALAALAGREIAIGRSWRNLPVVILVGLLGLASLLSHLEQAIDLDGLGDRLGIAVVAALMALIGGRIIPSFTHNWLKARSVWNLPAPFGAVDKAALALTLPALLLWVALPERPIVGALLLAGAAASAVRLARWRGAATLGEPLLLILHLGYAWLIVALAALGLAALELMPRPAALHAMTAGAFGTMTLAVMTRATLGHTGRALRADGWTVAIYGLVTLGALARVLAGLAPPGAYTPALHLAGLAWGGAFLLFALRYAPALLGPRAAPGAPEPRAPGGSPAATAGPRSPASDLR